MEASGPEGWFPVPDAAPDLRFPAASLPDAPAAEQPSGEPQAYPARPELSLSLRLPPDNPALCAPQQDIHGISAGHPALRLIPALPASGLWQALNAFHTPAAQVKVAVSGLRDFTLAPNGQPQANAPETPLEIFGPTPRAGSFVDVEAPDWNGKRLTSLRLRWNWNAPEHFARYFAAYPFSGIRLAPFCKSGAEGEWEAAGEAVKPEGGGLRSLDCPPPPDGRLHACRWQVEGNGSLFGHADYPALLARLTIAESSLLRRLWAFVTRSPRLKDLRPPYTPLCDAISLDYEAETDCDLTAPGTLTHIHPWPRSASAERLKLFAHHTEHALHLELDGLSGQLGKLPLSVHFSVQNLNPADDEAWSSAMTIQGAQATHDESRALRESGIMRLLLDAAQSADGRRRVSFLWTKRPAFAIQSILLHALRAVARPEATGGERPFPLPAGTLTEVSLPLDPPGSMPVAQPCASIGGRHAETAESAAFLRESAEYLSHRNQAILPRDYERLVLQEFPEVLAVRCLPRSGPSLDGKTPGAVALVVFAPPAGARIHRPDGSFTLDPDLPAYADEELLRAIREFLQARSSPFVRLHVAQPRYEALHVSLRGELMPGTREQEAVEETRRTLSLFFAPWAFAPEEALFGASPSGDGLLQRLEAPSWLAALHECVVDSPDRTPLALLRRGERQPRAIVAAAGPAGLFCTARMDIDFTGPQS